MADAGYLRIKEICDRMGCAPHQVCNLLDFAIFHEWHIHPARLESFLAERKPGWNRDESVEENLTRIFGAEFTKKVKN